MRVLLEKGHVMGSRPSRLLLLLQIMRPILLPYTAAQVSTKRYFAAPLPLFITAEEERRASASKIGARALPQAATYHTVGVRNTLEVR